MAQPAPMNPTEGAEMQPMHPDLSNAIDIEIDIEREKVGVVTGQP